MEKFKKNQIAMNEQSQIRGGWLHVVGGAIIWGLWEVFDDPESFKKGFKDGCDC